MVGVCSEFIVLRLILHNCHTVDKVKDYSQHHGKIVVVFEDPSMDILEIPYEATVMQGSVDTE